MKNRPLLMEIALTLVIIMVTALIAWGLFLRYRTLSRHAEVPENLKLIFEGAVTFSDRTALKRKMGKKAPWFPESSGTTPSVRCCSKGISQPCVPGGKEFTGYSQREWQTDTWKALHFQLKDPHLFRYEFKKTSIAEYPGFYAQAYGDLNCDGKESIFRRSGQIRGGKLEPGLSIEKVQDE
ncbi:hypothetical protein KKF84_16500 [Myxococcota bacterium]|nr:hypothetical protein [Myxococcota bacterium]MBU1536926.1 hypothetical protein [Myxococcota bacterium]